MSIEPETPQRRLTRSSDDRILGGVAGGVARYFDFDPIIARIVFAALALAGGFGLLAYVAAWLFVPDERTGRTVAAGNRGAAVLGIVVLIAALAVVSDGGLMAWAGPGLFLCVLAALLGYALWRAIGGEGTGSLLGRIVLVGVLGVAALVVMAAVTVGAALGGEVIVASLVIAAGLLVALGAFTGHLSWLLIPAVLIAAPAGAVAAADLDISGGVGERGYRPATMADLREGYELGIGELAIDLRDVDLPAGRTDLDVEIGAGRIVVFVGEDVCVAPDVRIGAGEADILGRTGAGIDVEIVEQRDPPASVKTLVLDADVGLGELEVVHSEAEIDGKDFWRRFDDGDHPEFLRGDGPLALGDRQGEACSASA